ncbi:MAG: alginate export family protein [Ignavibacteriales bacterium]|nr:alginate export family protein [Ignavibacteriales bacterium]
MKKVLLYILLIYFIVNFANYSQISTKFSAEIRPTLETYSDKLSDKIKVNSYSTIRTKLNALFEAQNNITGFIQLQDSRYFGEEKDPINSINGVDLHQGYIHVENMFGFQYNLKVGRFEYELGAGRLISPYEWSPVGRSFDGVVFTPYLKHVSIDVFGFKTDETLFSNDSLDAHLIGTRLLYKPSDYYIIEPYIFNEKKVSDSKHLDRFTTGLFIRGDISNFLHEAEFSYQWGNEKIDGIKQYTSAFMAAAKLGYTFKTKAVDLGLIAGLEYLSGDDNLSDNDLKAFTVPFGDIYKYYGNIEYIEDTKEDLFYKGLMDINAELFFNVIKAKLDISLAGHYFMTAQNYMLSDSSNSKQYGWELDLSLYYQYNDNLGLEGGIYYFAPLDILRDTNLYDKTIWLYLTFYAYFE